MTQPISIVGAGLAGLIAAHAWPQAQVLEAASEPTEAHNALLRFRTPNVGALTGIEFRRVTVRKGIWMDGDFIRPSIRAANLYEAKVLGSPSLRGERSIWNVEAAERFVAPPDFYARLLAQVRPRIRYGHAADFLGFSKEAREGFLINTAPLPIVLDALGIKTSSLFERAAIEVRRFLIPGADLYQTIYFPSPRLGVYRASMTGEILIVESVAAGSLAGDLSEIARAFGLSWASAFACELPRVRQRYGKIVALPNAERKRLLFELTHHHRILSLGRFATWRNILLDDVVQDVAVIKRLINSADAYDLRRAAA